jgi:hypothetical protein
MLKTFCAAACAVVVAVIPARGTHAQNVSASSNFYAPAANSKYARMKNANPKESPGADMSIFAASHALNLQIRGFENRPPKFSRGLDQGVNSTNLKSGPEATMTYKLAHLFQEASNLKFGDSLAFTLTLPGIKQPGTTAGRPQRFGVRFRLTFP